MDVSGSLSSRAAEWLRHDGTGTRLMLHTKTRRNKNGALNWIRGAVLSPRSPQREDVRAVSSWMVNKRSNFYMEGQYLFPASCRHLTFLFLLTMIISRSYFSPSLINTFQYLNLEVPDDKTLVFATVICNTFRMKNVVCCLS